MLVNPVKNFEFLESWERRLSAHSSVLKDAVN